MHFVQLLEERQEERSVRLVLQESGDACPTVSTLTCLSVVISLRRCVSLCVFSFQHHPIYPIIRF